MQFVVDVAAKLPTAVICEMMGVDREHYDLMFTLANMSNGLRGSGISAGPQRDRDRAIRPDAVLQLLFRS